MLYLFSGQLRTSYARCPKIAFFIVALFFVFVNTLYKNKVSFLCVFFVSA